MSQEFITCRKCLAENPINSPKCMVCGLSLNKAKETKVLSELQPGVKDGSAHRWKQSSVPLFPSLGLAIREVTGRINRKQRLAILLILPFILVIPLYLFSPQIRYLFSLQTVPQSTPRPTPTPNVPPIGPDGIGVTLKDGEYIGISDGRYAFDTNRAAGPLMLQASESLRNGNFGPALAEWDAAHEKDTDDAEPLIYAEDQRVQNSGNAYITIVLGISLHVKVNEGFSRDVLQAAYLVQKECNENPQLAGGKKLRLLIANSGSKADRSKDIAKQVVQAAQFDKTILGVEGWTTSVTTLNALPILVQAHLPIVASDTASDKLTGQSQYFFRVGTPTSVDVNLTTAYIEKKFAPQHLVIFRDPAEPYSWDSSKDFSQKFTKDGYHIDSIEDFTTGDKSALTQYIQKDFKAYKPDFIMIATIDVGDVTTVLNNIPTTAEYANLKVLAGGAGYELVRDGGTPTGYTRMLLSSSAFPDEWSILAPNNPQPPFFKEYPATYDPHDQHFNFPYGYRRANDGVMMHYDALSVFLGGSKIATQQGKQDPTREDMQNALLQINGAQSFQGITGAISFGPDSNPINKLNFVLHVVDGGYTHVAAYQGCLLVGSPCDNSIVIKE